MTVRFRSRTDALQPEHSVNYSYDPMNRLTQAGAVNGSWSIAWTLDAWGNRTAQTPGGLATSLVGSQTLGYSNNRNTLFSYDNAGNVTNDGLHTYSMMPKAGSRRSTAGRSHSGMTQKDAG